MIHEWASNYKSMDFDALRAEVGRLGSVNEPASFIDRVERLAFLATELALKGPRS